MDFIKHPSTVNILIRELKRSVDMYLNRKIPEKFLKDYVDHLVQNESKKMFSGDDFNPTLKQRLGVKRLSVIEAFMKDINCKL